MRNYVQRDSAVSITIKKCCTKHNDTQHNGTRYCYAVSLCWLSFMLSVANETIVLSVIMMNVVCWLSWSHGNILSASHSILYELAILFVCLVYICIVLSVFCLVSLCWMPLWSILWHSISRSSAAQNGFRCPLLLYFHLQVV